MQPRRQPGKTEFAIILAMLMATVALSIDAMMPALPQIAADLTPDAPNRAQLVLTSVLLGMGIGTLFVGPISDSFGRRPVIFCGSAVFCIGAILASQAQTLELLLYARVLQGLGGSAFRVVTIAMIRDLYSGRQMAQMVSFVMILFTLVPAIAPSLGAAILQITSWRGIFVAFVLFTAASVTLMIFRQPETLAPDHRRPLRVGPIIGGVREVLTHPTVRRAMLVQTMGLSVLFTMLSSIQMIIDQTFGRADSFPLWFALIALFGSGAGFLNARLVMRLGMRTLVIRTFALQIAVGFVFVLGTEFSLWPDGIYFPAYLVLAIVSFASAALVLGNISALALEPMGHIAGTASSVIAAFSTVGAVLIAVPIGLMFNGTPMPAALGNLVFAIVAFFLMRSIRAPEGTLISG